MSHKARYQNLLARLLIISAYVHLSHNADLTRSSGLVNYPSYNRGLSNSTLREHDQWSTNEQMDRWMSKIRILLTRNITRDQSRLREPELSYFGAIGLGTSPKMFNVVFDTNSGETWLPKYNWFPFANNLHYSEGYSCSDSSTCSDSRRECNFNYKNTELDGDVFQDTFTFYQDMLKDDALHLVSDTLLLRHGFIAISKAEDEQFRYKPYDGVIGLAPTYHSRCGVMNLILSLQNEQQAQIRQNNQIDQSHREREMSPRPNQALYNQQRYVSPARPVFSFWFNANQNSRHGGELMLGGIDENRFIGEIFYHRVPNFTKWELQLSYVMFGNAVSSCSNGCYAVLDTGAKSLVGPREDVEKMYQHIQAAYHQESNLWLVDCTNLEHYPTMSFIIDGKTYLILPGHYIKQFKFQEHLYCHLAIKPWNQRDWLLGTSFIEAYYTVFDFGNRRIGFASPQY